MVWIAATSARVLWLETYTPPRTLREMRLVAATLPRPRHPWRLKPTPFAKLRRSDAVISDKTCCTMWSSRSNAQPAMLRFSN